MCYNSWLFFQAIRTQEGNEAQVCFYIIQLLLLKSKEFHNQMVDFVRENSPDHWKQSNWYVHCKLIKIVIDNIKYSHSVDRLL